MKVLVFNGSPKGEHSNTMHLTRAFLKGAAWTDAEIVDVANANVKGCLGCFACWNKTPGKCIINDGMAEILDKIIAADVIVWSFPLYYFSVPGGLKNLIDRQLPLNLPFMAEGVESGGHPSRYDLSRQKHIVISTCGFWSSKGNYDGVISMFDHFCGKGNYTAILCGQGELFSVPELKNRIDTYLEIVCRGGAEYAAGGIRVETQGALEEPLYPRDVFEKMADASWGITKGEDAKVPAEESLRFTVQMAALYRPDGMERVLEFHYTDIQKTYQILLTKEGSNVITDGFRPYTTRIETPYSLWRSISRNEISGQDALFQRLYTVRGDFSLMLKWDELFGAYIPAQPSPADPQRKTNMLIFLVPWIVIWTVIAINPIIGSAAGIVVTTLVTLLWLVFRPVVFEQVSVPIVAGLSLAVLLGGDIRLIVSASYFIFGLLWIVGAFTKIPLTAHYSAENYGKERAFANRLFIKTNRILTAAWGGLYLVTAVWTYILMGTGFSPYIGAINSVLPVLMGIYTAWFQKWYPARWARG
ncbi:2-amino-4-deoxychorismate dehydrogenase [Anaerotignum neopropionicum]|mgnify:CR=1 FL=1|uniref:2-amino-4-deoxychorismate dehydrogenase n=1 Tax=Anaerotignum neopropionicum TaxID=36847 RepID=A0A136WHU6_9FIRM|nr:flavodoxin family protein [Anaerotignum neopropionicum]KXL54115.1 2-amino-4-deoxychorismate dehydrogenase [Anaerotignum neopropionicum]